MSGDIKAKYASAADYTFTSLNSLAGSSGFTAGAVSLAVDNTSLSGGPALDFQISGKITWSSTAPAAGTYSLQIWVYGNLDDTPNYPQDGSGNALGTDVARTFAQAVDVSNACRNLKNIDLFTTASKVYTFSEIPLSSVFGPWAPPKFHGLFITHGVTTSGSTPGTGTSRANAITYTPILSQYT